MMPKPSPPYDGGKCGTHNPADFAADCKRRNVSCLPARSSSTIVRSFGKTVVFVMTPNMETVVDRCEVIDDSYVSNVTPDMMFPVTPSKSSDVSLRSRNDVDHDHDENDVNPQHPPKPNPDRKPPSGLRAVRKRSRTAPSTHSLYLNLLPWIRGYRYSCIPPRGTTSAATERTERTEPDLTGPVCSRHGSECWFGCRFDCR